jgi:hypothetical protein
MIESLKTLAFDGSNEHTPFDQVLRSKQGLSLSKHPPEGLNIPSLKVEYLALISTIEQRHKNQTSHRN